MNVIMQEDDAKQRLVQLQSQMSPYEQEQFARYVQWNFMNI